MILLSHDDPSLDQWNEELRNVHENLEGVEKDDLVLQLHHTVIPPTLHVVVPLDTSVMRLLGICNVND
jgi:hypothetical protein